MSPAILVEKLRCKLYRKGKKGNLTCGQLRSRRFLLSDELKGNICKLLPYLTKEKSEKSRA